MIVVVDYGVGNLGSLLNMFRAVGADAMASGAPAAIKSADRIVLPGVGAFDSGMNRLRQSALIPELERRVRDGIPLLGVCLGMQLLTEASEEGGGSPGLGWLDAKTVRFSADRLDSGTKVPHMGWNSVKLLRPSPLLDVDVPGQRFYFAHSYHVVCQSPADVIGTTSYGGGEFTSVINRANVWGAQFHPEKSLRWGMAFLNHFANYKSA